MTGRLVRSVPALCSLALGLGACTGIATIPTQFDLPRQELNAVAPEGRVAVVFFNSSNRLTHGLDGSGKINVFVRTRSLASLEIGEYVQVMLEPGEHEITLAHWDIGTLVSSHLLQVEGDRVFVEVKARTTSNELRVREGEPPGFARYFEPARTLGRGP